ncbi:MAG: biopolymer transporter ExbD [Crocinitomicaceae bacterium]|nr:biopolymer transporter ExbD [Crocinitomicaceae bacterium]
MDLGRRNKVKLEGGMSSMTDLIFLMLIFFIIMSTMAKNTLPVDLPSNSSANKDNADGPVEIGITENNTYFFDPNNPENYTFEEVIGVLEQKMAESGQENLKISGDKAANYETIFNIIALAKQKEWKPVLTYSK